MWVGCCAVKCPTAGNSGASFPIPGFPTHCRHCPLFSNFTAPNPDLPHSPFSAPSLLPCPVLGTVSLHPGRRLGPTVPSHALHHPAWASRAWACLWDQHQQMLAEQDSTRALAAQRPGLRRPHLWSGTPGSPSSGRSCPSRSAGTCGYPWPGRAQAFCSHRSGRGQGPWHHARRTTPGGHRHTQAGTRCPSPRRSGGHKAGQQIQKGLRGQQVAPDLGLRTPAPGDPRKWSPPVARLEARRGPGWWGNDRQGLSPDQTGVSLGSSEGDSPVGSARPTACSPHRSESPRALEPTGNRRRPDGTEERGVHAGWGVGTLPA